MISELTPDCQHVCGHQDVSRCATRCLPESLWIVSRISRASLWAGPFPDSLAGLKYNAVHLTHCGENSSFACPAEIKGRFVEDFSPRTGLGARFDWRKSTSRAFTGQVINVVP